MVTIAMVMRGRSNGRKRGATGVASAERVRWAGEVIPAPGPRPVVL